MMIEIDSCWRKITFSNKHIIFLNKGKAKFLQINTAKNMKRDSVCAFVHMRRDNPSHCTQLYAFWMTILLCTGATFVKKNSWLVARIVSFDTTGLHLFRSAF